MKNIYRLPIAALIALLTCASSVRADDAPVNNAKVPVEIDVSAVVARLIEETIVIRAGELSMGDASEKTQSPVHSVKIPAFALGKYLVTRGDFAAFLSDTDYPAGTAWRKPYFKQTPRDPVINVNWNDVQAFVQWLSRKTNKKFRLPTEAEWEYAARAGTTTKYYWGDKVGDKQANCSGCGSQWDSDSTAPVGSFAPNPWGLYDMAGNAGEWTQDCYRENYLDAPTDGSAVSGGDCKYRVVRGGSWSDSANNIGSTFRDPYLPDFRYGNIGFRLVREVE